MARSCTICVHPAREAVDEALVDGTPYRDIAKRHAVTPSALTRHRQQHLSPALVAIRAGQQDQHQKSLADRLEDLVDELEALLRAAVTVDQALKVIAEKRKQLMSIARLTGELDERPQVSVFNVWSSPDWQLLQSVMLAALERHPEAKADVLAAIARAAGGGRMIEGTVIEG